MMVEEGRAFFRNGVMVAFIPDGKEVVQFIEEINKTAEVPFDLVKHMFQVIQSSTGSTIDG